MLHVALENFNVSCCLVVVQILCLPLILYMLLMIFVLCPHCQDDLFPMIQILMTKANPNIGDKVHLYVFNCDNKPIMCL